jgi:transposase InsO family protein
VSVWPASRRWISLFPAALSRELSQELLDEPLDRARLRGMRATSARRDRTRRGRRTSPTSRPGKDSCTSRTDLFSRRIVGWSMAHHLRAELVIAALEMALARRPLSAQVIWQRSRFANVRCSCSCSSSPMTATPT